MAEQLGRSITVGVIGEDLPEAHNRVTLDPDLTDSDGVPAPKVEYKMSDNSLKMMAHGVDRAIELLEAAGAKGSAANPLLEPSGWHLMGTARMGTGSSTSVLDGWGRAHDVRNLFIIDGSTWVTGGAVNPTSTIQALALRTAELREERGQTPPGLKAMTSESKKPPTFLIGHQLELTMHVLDRIVPRQDRFPGAGELGVASYVDAAIGRSAHSRRLFSSGLRAIDLLAHRSTGAGIH